MVWQVANAVKIPVIGIGGIMSCRDVLEFIMAGASAVEIGTGNFIDPAITGKISKQLEDYFEIENICSIEEIRGIV